MEQGGPRVRRLPDNGDLYTVASESEHLVRRDLFGRAQRSQPPRIKSL